MKPIAIFLAEKLEDIVSNENWLLVNNAADELRRLQAKVDQLEAARKPLTDEEIKRRKPISADFVSFRAGVRCMEREYGSGAKP